MIINSEFFGVNNLSRLNPNKLHVSILPPATVDSPLFPRCYTLTHSDQTGDLFLTIGVEFNKKQLRGWQTRIMRDEVLAEWLKTDDNHSLNVYCQISGGIGTSGFRDRIFRQELPLVLETFRYGDQQFFDANPEFDKTPIFIHFRSKKDKYNKIENWGFPENYKIRET